VKKAEDLLKSLPEATPVAIKKQIVEASLKAFGFEIEKIVAAAHNQKKAIDTYVRVNETSTAKAIQDAETQIRTLNEKIAALQADIEKRTAGLGGLNAAAEIRKADVQKVIDFFQGPPAPATPGGQ
jgi:flagellar motility protein MotE (MotC chaperone)